jgi:hypothetical protein
VTGTTTGSLLFPDQELFIAGMEVSIGSARTGFLRYTYQIEGCSFLSTVDINEAFHMVRIHPDDCHKTAFQTRFGLFEYTVSPFGLSNSPASFMKVMNRILFDLVDQCVVYYVDDVLIYSDSREQHLTDIQRVFTRLRDKKLHVKLSKCVFIKQTLPFCGVNVGIYWFSVSDTQIDSMCQYPEKQEDYPAAKYVMEFMGSVRFFQDFIPWLADIAVPLYRLTMKDNRDTWNANHVSVIRVIQFHLYFPGTWILRFRASANFHYYGRFELCSWWVAWTRR